MLGENKRLFLQMASRQLQLAEKNNRMRFFGSPRAPSPGLANRVLTHAARQTLGAEAPAQDAGRKPHVDADSPRTDVRGSSIPPSPQALSRLKSAARQASAPPSLPRLKPRARRSPLRPRPKRPHYPLAAFSSARCWATPTSSSQCCSTYSGGPPIWATTWATCSVGTISMASQGHTFRS